MTPEKSVANPSSIKATLRLKPGYGAPTNAGVLFNTDKVLPVAKVPQLAIVESRHTTGKSCTACSRPRSCLRKKPAILPVGPIPLVTQQSRRSIARGDLISGRLSQTLPATAVRHKELTACYNPREGELNDEPRRCSADVEERA